VIPFPSSSAPAFRGLFPSGKNRSGKLFHFDHSPAFIGAAVRADPVGQLGFAALGAGRRLDRIQKIMGPSHISSRS